MEQKRVLWIVAAVGLFLLVVIGTALWISSPLNKMQPSLSTVQVAGNSWSRSNVQNAASNADLYGVNASSSADTIKNIDFTGDANAQSQAPVNLNNLDASAPSAANTQNTANGTDSAQNSSSAAQTAPSTTDARTSSAGLAQTAVTLNVNITPSSNNATAYTEVPKQTAPATSAQTVQPATTGASSNQQSSGAAASTASTSSAGKTTAPAASSQATQPVQSTAAAPKATASASTAAASTTKPATSTSTASNNVKPVPTTQPDQFWVQVASFTGKKNAEDARSALSEQKITGEVFTYQDVKGTIYYRLRVGPYKTKSEAEYWHKIIKEIEQFKGTDSYVVNSTVR